MNKFENFKINCSQISSLMGNAAGNTPPTSKQIQSLFNTLGKEYFELSESMKHNAKEILLKAIDYEPNRPSEKILSELVLIYCSEMFGKTKINKGAGLRMPTEMEKGIGAEPESIKLLSRIDGIDYVKNEELFENKWMKGIPDIIVRSNNGTIKKVIEIKTSYDLPSFILSSQKKEPSHNIYQVMGYMDLVGCKEAEVVHCLVDMPNNIVSFEEKRMRERFKLLEMTEIEAEEKVGAVIANMEYSNIPENLKVFRRKYTINKLTLKAVKSRVTVARKWMKEIHESFTENSLNLSEMQLD
jgi:hypothetical protein